MASNHRTLAKAIEAYLCDLRQRGCASKTQQQRRYILERFNDFLKRETQVVYPNQLTLRDAQAFVASHSGPVTRYPSHSICRPRLDERYSTHTLRTYVGTLRTFSRWLQQQKDCPEAVFDALEMPPISSNPSTSMSREIWSRVLGSINRKTVRGKRLFVIITLLGDGGLSSRELVNLRIGDWDGQCVTVRRSKQTERLVPVGVASQKAIVDYLKNARPQSPADHLILSETGVPLTPNALTQILCRLARRSSVDKISVRTLHQLSESGFLLKTLS
jgi:site-specific recombinase XerD